MITNWLWPVEFLRGWIWMHFHTKMHNSNRKSHFSKISFKSFMDQIWPCHKIGQSQPRVIIYINLNLTPQMLHSRFQGNWPSGSGEDFLGLLPCIGHGHLGNVTWTKYKNFLSPIAWRLHMKFNWNWPSSFKEEVFWRCWRTMDGRQTTEATIL